MILFPSSTFDNEISVCTLGLSARRSGFSAYFTPSMRTSPVFVTTTFLVVASNSQSGVDLYSCNV